MVIGMDFYPTFLELAGLKPLPEEHKDGISLAPLLTGEGKALERNTLFWHYPHYHRTKPFGAIREGDWKLIEFIEDGEMELFDLKSDPAEGKNLAKEKPEKAADLLTKLKAWRVSVNAQMMTPNPNYEPTGQSAPRKKNRPKK